MKYQSWFYINKPVGNNEFSYKKRINLWSKWKIYVTNIKKWNLNDLGVGNKIVFQEVVKNKLVSCVWLRNFLWIKKWGKNVFIVDNHNYALYFRYRALKEWIVKKWIKLIHIDQHSDMKENKNKLNWNNIWKFVNEKTNVGNFIYPAIKSWLINEIIQVRTEVKLNEIWLIPNLPAGRQGSKFLIPNFILDIDMDFRVGKNDVEKDFEIVRKLIKKAKIITIATSPYFMDQNLAINLIKKLFR